MTSRPEPVPAVAVPCVVSARADRRGKGSTSPRTTRRWARLRAAKLRANPICEAEACARPAIEVDHLTPLAEDLSLRYEWSNLCATCAEHHRQKSTADALRGKRRLR